MRNPTDNSVGISICLTISNISKVDLGEEPLGKILLLDANNSLQYLRDKLIFAWYLEAVLPCPTHMHTNAHFVYMVFNNDIIIMINHLYSIRYKL